MHTHKSESHISPPSPPGKLFTMTLRNETLHTLASSLAGLIAAIASTPVDRAKTLLMASRGVYSSVLSCLAHIARTRGLSGLYQGFFATWMRLGPWAFLFFVCYEQYKAALTKVFEAHEQKKLQ